MSAVLLFTGGMPVVIRHAHAVDRDRDLERHHPEDYLALAPAARRQAETHGGPEHVAGCLLPVAAHVHLFVFGLEFTFEAATPHGSRDDDSTGSAPESSMLARLIEADRLQAQSPDDGGSLPIAERAAVSARVAPGLAQPSARRFIFRPLVSRPLCDSARHERSGVQRI